MYLQNHVAIMLLMYVDILKHIYIIHLNVFCKIYI